MSEYDRQMKLLNAGIKKPDQVIKAISVIKSEGSGDELGENCYWFLTPDDKVILVDMREEASDDSV